MLCHKSINSFAEFKNEEPIKEETNKKDDKEEKDDSLSSFINMISGLDVDKISDGLNGMKKILNNEDEEKKNVTL